MPSPILLYSDGEFAVYKSIEAAESDLEPIDVLNNEYTIYDAAGQLLEASVPEVPLAGWRRRIWGATVRGPVVKINRSASGEVGGSELEDRLRNYLRTIGGGKTGIRTTELESASLAWLLRWVCSWAGHG